MSSRETRVLDYCFYGAMIPPTTAVEGPWVKTDTSSGGTPTMLTVGNAMTLTLDSTDEAENLCLSWGDVLSIDIDDLMLAEFWWKASALGAENVIVVGLGSARHDTPDSVAANCWFRLDGVTGAIKIETDDGVTDTDDVATGVTFAASPTIKKCVMDFSNGILTRSPPSTNLGGKANVLFSIEDSAGVLRPVARSQHFSLAGYSAGLQPIVQVSKTGTGTDSSVPSVALQRCRFTLRDR